MKFFTSNEKPTVKGLIIATVLLLIAELAVLLCLKDNKVYVAGYLFEYYLISVWIILMVMAKKQINYNPYTHYTIMYIGFGIFALINSIANALILIGMNNDPEAMNLGSIFGAIAYSMTNFSWIVAPFLLIFSILLAVSNIQLIRKEGYRFVNLLGLILSFMIVGGFVFLWWLTYYTSGSQFEVFISELIYNVLYAIYVYFVCMLLGSIITNIIVSHHIPEADKGFIIILGCGMRKDGTPTPLLRSRIDRAIEFARYQERKSGKLINFIPSGGQGSDEIISESQCMKNYLMQQGISEGRILLEERSTTTSENMRFSKEIIDSIDPNEKAAYATNNYHVLRSGMFATENGLKAEGIGAKTKWYFWPNAAVREFVGMITRHKRLQIAVVMFIILFYSFAIWMSYYGIYLFDRGF